MYHLGWSYAIGVLLTKDRMHDNLPATRLLSKVQCYMRLLVDVSGEDASLIMPWHVLLRSIPISYWNTKVWYGNKVGRSLQRMRNEIYGTNLLDNTNNIAYMRALHRLNMWKYILLMLSEYPDEDKTDRLGITCQGAYGGSTEEEKVIVCKRRPWVRQQA